MSDNPRIEKLLSSVLPVAGLTWATRRPLGVGGVVGIGAVGVDDVIEVVADRDAEVLDAADALALAWATHIR